MTPDTLSGNDSSACLITRPLFDGTREVKALWFDPALIGEPETHRRIIAHWQPQARLFRLFGGYLLEWPQARQYRCAALDGLPLCDQGGILSSAPLTPQERAGATGGSVWLIAGARAEVATPGVAERIDPSIWLKVGQIALREPLRPPKKDTVLTLPDPEKNKSVREILGDKIPVASAESQKFLQDLAMRGKTGRAAGPGTAGSARSLWPLGNRPGHSGKGQAGGALRGAGSALAAMASLAGLSLLGTAAGLLGWLPMPGATGPGHARRGGRQVSGNASATPASPAQPGPLALMLNRFAVKVANATQLSRLLGWRQANYLRKMMDMFEEGDWMEALRHAIPLGGEATQNNQTALGTPGPRDSLSISSPDRPSSQMHLAPDLQAYLRQAYRRTFDRLVREGKIDEAVFVLAELLNCGAEAVNFLETRERFKQAAELAETLQLAAPIAIRLWWLAKDRDRAIRLAILHNAFAEAVTLLERDNQAQIVPLRERWAAHLAARGELTEAVDVIWPLVDQRPQALAWLLQAEQAGGTLGVRALCRKLALLPESLADSVAAIEAVLQAPGSEGVILRARMVNELLALGNQSAASRKLAGALYRKVLPESVRGANRLDKPTLERLLTLADMPLLKADLPGFAIPAAGIVSARLQARTPPLLASLNESGLQPILDACILPDQHYLLALGEAGVVRVNRLGKRIAHFPVPAHRLVIAKNGQSALALVKRNDTWRISRIDLQRRSVADWLSLPLRFWAPQYDGAIWNVVLENRLLALDTLKPQLTSIWQVSDLPGQIIAFDDNGEVQTMLIAGKDCLQQWRYRLPARMLNQRDPLPLPDSDVWQLLPCATEEAPLKLYLMEQGEGRILSVRSENNGAVHHRGGRFDPATGKIISDPTTRQDLKLPLGKISQPPKLELGHGWLVASVERASGHHCLVAEFGNCMIRANLQLPSSSESRARLHEGHVLFFNLQGGLIDLDVATCQVTTLCLS